MASTSREANGNRRIQFASPDGSRKTLRLGTVSQRTAESIKYRVEQLLESILFKRPMEADLIQWVNSLESTLAKKLVKAGLIAEQEKKTVVTLGPFLTSYLDAQTDLKSATKIVRGQVIHDLTEFFGESRDVRTIQPGDADDFKQWLVGRKHRRRPDGPKLSTATIHKRLQVARSFFHAMCRRKLIEVNPFEGVNAAATGIQDRQCFVTRQEIDRLLEVCPDHHWRAIVALSRYGGLRTPSETLSLRWQDIDWAHGRILVTSPKTEHHAGKANRTIPLFPELREILSEAFELAPEGATYVVDERFRKAAMGPRGWMDANLRTSLKKFILRAGLKPWPRLIQNLRASRETELVELYPVQVVTSWLGNTPKVAMRHYLMTTDQHFESAIRGDKSAANQHSQKATQNPTQRVPDLSRNDPHELLPVNAKTPVFPGYAGHCELTQSPKVAGAGFEPTTSRL